MDNPIDLDILPTEHRLALAYAHRDARAIFLSFFALDARLATIVRNSREPLLAQLRMAWWRDRLTAPIGPDGDGEPLLAALHGWGAERAALAALVDGWEALLGDAPLKHAALAEFGAGRGAACTALSRQLDHPEHADDACQAGMNWAWADLAARLSHPDERSAAIAALAAADWSQPSLPRALRPLAVLNALARRGQDGRGLAFGPVSLLTAMRVGLLGF
jgi:phytoene synthase